MTEKNALLPQRTHYCGELRSKNIGDEVFLYGWIHKARDIGNLVFIDLRDREGVVQVVITSEKKSILEKSKKLRMEYVIGVKGRVKEREAGLKNPRLPTGNIEVQAEEVTVLSKAAPLPFVLSDPSAVSEEIRFKYRYLDLRRPSLQHNIKLRHQAAFSARSYLSEKGFIEIETPFLTKSTPEGARDYLVPSRIYKGRFFALPQSPQLFKQILMVSGFDKYFQIVRCFRDEDLRADRQPEFTQIDIEMSFIRRETLFSLVEGLMASMFAVNGIEIETPFPRLSYLESRSKYGTDKPDLRYDLDIKDLTGLGESIDSEIVKAALSGRGKLKGLCMKGSGDLSRSQLSKLDAKAKELGGKGLIWIKKQDGLKSSLRLSVEALGRIWNACLAADKDLVFLAADNEEVADHVLRTIGRSLSPEKTEGSRAFKFAWIKEFPLFEWSEEENRLLSMHHPFTAPMDEDLDDLKSQPQKVRAKAYDLVLNGFEIGGGSIRIHDLKTQKRVFQALGLNEKEYMEKFGFFLEALSFGTPPHGGIALGFDRIVMLLAGEDSIREVIPFPKTTSSLCLMTDSPSRISEDQMKELGLNISPGKKGKT